MKIKRIDLNRLIESYLKDHMLLTTSLSSQATLKEYSFDEFTKDITSAYGTIENYASELGDEVKDAADSTVDFLEDQYNLITNLILII